MSGVSLPPLPPDKTADVEGAIRRVLAWHAAMGLKVLSGILPRSASSLRLKARETVRREDLDPVQQKVSPSVASAVSRPLPGRPRFAEVVGQLSDPLQIVEQAQRDARQAKTLSQWIEAIEAFHLCPLRAGANRTVVVDGAPRARILLLGEGPGADEDRIGRPFVGRSGQLLDSMLASIGLSRQENVLISNMVYWRPPMNRTPDPEELKVCAPFVRQLIDLIRPHTIVLLGKTAFAGVIDPPRVLSLKAVRGRVYRADSQPLGRLDPVPIDHTEDPVALVSYHPAYLLRQPMAKALAWDDLVLLRRRVEAVGTGVTGRDS